jgi:hypothetical protein
MSLNASVFGVPNLELIRNSTKTCYIVKARHDGMKSEHYQAISKFVVRSVRMVVVHPSPINLHGRALHALWHTTTG